MPPTYLQAARAMTVTTPLGQDALLLIGLSGHEAISQPFRFELDLAAEDRTRVVFEEVLGRKVTISLALPGEKKRFLSGICASLTQGMRGVDHTTFRMEIVPYFWLLTQHTRSRIFQNKTVIDILRTVLDVIPDVVYDVTKEGEEQEDEKSLYYPRNYCVQYRESDFQFASRLMEEEGIYYYFRHSADGHQMVLSNKDSLPELQPSKLVLQQMEGSHVEEFRVTRWEKHQHLRPGKVRLRDHNFEMPQQSLEAHKDIQDKVLVGQQWHKLKFGEDDYLQIDDWPGGYARRFDAIDRNGHELREELPKILKENERTAKIRMQQEASESIVIHGRSRYRHLVSGHTFTLTEQPIEASNGDANRNGQYMLTSVHHTGQMSSAYRSGDAHELRYENSFTCIPTGLPFRPQRVTPKPVITGTQTAVVVGPRGDEIYTDKYGRVKVQFHWDREGRYDVDSSCWVRVSTLWAGKSWGAINIPRIGQEVIVAFEEGDPDRPIIIGSVYNADNMPPYPLPEGKVSSGIKSNSTPGGQGYNEIAFDDTKHREKITVHAQCDKNTTVEHDDSLTVRNNRSINVDGTHSETIRKDTTISIAEGTFTHKVLAKTADYYVKGKVTETFDASQETTVAKDIDITAKTGHVFVVAQAEIKLDSKEDAVRLWAAKEIKLRTGSSEIFMLADGTIRITGKKIALIADQEVTMGVGNQNVTCNKMAVATSGAAITSSAIGSHEIVGALVKIN
jgi:type VI secretion system secreted protein VgrG